MRHEVLVRMLHGRAGGAEQRQPLRLGQGVVLRVPRDRRAVEVFHDDVGDAVIRDATIEELRDVGMLQSRQNAPLGGKQLRCVARQQSRAHELDGHRLLEEPIAALSPIDRSHAAFPDQSDNAVDPDALWRANGLTPAHLAGRRGRRGRGTHRSCYWGTGRRIATRC